MGLSTLKYVNIQSYVHKSRVDDVMYSLQQGAYSRVTELCQAVLVCSPVREHLRPTSGPRHRSSTLPLLPLQPLGIMSTGVEAKLLKSTKFPVEYSKKVDMQKVNLDVMKQYGCLH